jgi:hypothetical protein
VLERDVEEGGARLGEYVLPIPEFAVDPDPSPAAVGHPRGHRQELVDQDRPAVADEDPRRHGGEAVPGREEAAGLVERGADDPAVDDPRRGLVALREREGRLVALDSLRGWERKVDAIGIVPAPPA